MSADKKVAFKSLNELLVGSEPSEQAKPAAQENKQPEPTPQPVTEVAKKKPATAKKKASPGRPKKFNDINDTEILGIRVLKSEARFLEEHGGIYGGKTGYVRKLVQEEMRRINSNAN